MTVDKNVDETANPSPVSDTDGQAALLADAPLGDTPKGVTQRRPGGQRGNVSALRTHSRGSKMPLGCRHEELLVAETVERVKSEWHARHGDGIWPAWADNLLQQIRRASERDRVAAKLLRTLKDLKGGDLSHADQERQRAIQESALQTIERCLERLGLGPEAEQDVWLVEATPARDIAEYAQPAAAAEPPTADEPTQGPESCPAASSPTDDASDNQDDDQDQAAEQGDEDDSGDEYQASAAELEEYRRGLRAQA